MSVKSLRRKVANDPRVKVWFSVVDEPSIQKGLDDADKGLVLLFNNRSKRYEVHNLSNTGPSTYAFVSPFGLTLDSRLILHAKKISITQRGDAVFDEIERNNQAIKDGRDRAYKNEMDSRGKEVEKDLSLSVERDEMYDGYKRVHTVGGLA